MWQVLGMTGLTRLFLESKINEIIRLRKIRECDFHCMVSEVGSQVPVLGGCPKNLKICW